MPGIDSLVFDVGGVLLDWNPRHLYRKLFDDDATVERFLAETALHEWHVREHDPGRRPMSETIPEMCRRSPTTPPRSRCGRTASWRTSGVSSTAPSASSPTRAAGCGFNTVLFRSPDQLRRELSPLLASDPA